MALITGNAPAGRMIRIELDGNTPSQQSDFRALALDVLATAMGAGETVAIEQVAKVAWAINVSRKMAGAERKLFDAKELRKQVLVTMAARGAGIFRGVETPANLDMPGAAEFVDGLLDVKAGGKMLAYLLPRVKDVFELGARCNGAIEKHADKFAPCFTRQTFNTCMSDFILLATPYARAAYLQLKAERAAKKSETVEKTDCEKILERLGKVQLNPDEIATLLSRLNAMHATAQADADAGATLIRLKNEQAERDAAAAAVAAAEADADAQIEAEEIRRAA